MPDESIFESDVIGRASDLVPELKLQTAPAKEPIHPLVSLEELERPSPTPHKGRSDKKHPELDSLDPLYIPRFLVREWGTERYLRCAYHAAWKAEAGRKSRLADPKPVRK